MYQLQTQFRRLYSNVPLENISRKVLEVKFLLAEDGEPKKALENYMDVEELEIPNSSSPTSAASVARSKVLCAKVRHVWTDRNSKLIEGLLSYYVPSQSSLHSSPIS